MFKRISIELTAPICPCPRMSLAWGITREGTGKAGLHVECKLCGTTLTVPHKRFVATFGLDTPYPGVSDEPDAPKLEVLDGGKVLQFDRSEEQPKDKGTDEDVS